MCFHNEGKTQLDALRQHGLQQRAGRLRLERDASVGILFIKACDRLWHQVVAKAGTATYAKVTAAVLGQVFSHFVDTLHALVDRIDFLEQPIGLRCGV